MKRKQELKAKHERVDWSAIRRRIRPDVQSKLDAAREMGESSRSGPKAAEARH